MTNINQSKTENAGNNKDEPLVLRGVHPSFKLNKGQKLHLAGEFDVYAPITQENSAPLPPLAVQWKEDARRRYGYASSRNW